MNNKYYKIRNKTNYSDKKYKNNLIGGNVISIRSFSS